MKKDDLKTQRRKAREWALQLLFQLDFTPGREGVDAALESFWSQQWHTQAHDIRDQTGATPLPPETPAEAADAVAPAKIRAFVEHLVRGVLANRENIDAQMAPFLRNWTINRMSVVDRNVLRLAFFEIWFSDKKAPPVAVLNEAIDLAKYFSNSESGRFINGVLDRALKDAPKPPAN